MAASVTYQIKGKYDNKAVKTAQADLTAFGKSIKGLGVAAWAKLSTELISGLKKVVDGSAESFINQNNAVKKLDTAIKASNKDFNELLKYQDKLSKNNFFDGDALNNAQAMAINMGLNQKQVIAVMDAAEELTAAGIMPLDQAVKALSLSYSGNTTALAKTIPQVKEFTTDALKSGAAVDLVKKQYEGMADAMVNTFGGRNTQFSNATGDLKNSIGGIVQSLKYIEQGKWIEPINKVTKWMEENRENILKGIIALPSIAKEVLQLINDMVKTTFAPDNFMKLFRDISKIALTAIKALCNSMMSLLSVFYTELGAMTSKFLGKSGMFRKIDSWAGAVVNNLNAKLFGWILNLEENIKSLGEPWASILGFVVDQTPIGIFKKLVSDSEGNLKKWNENENWEGYTSSTTVYDKAFDDFEKTFVKEFNTLAPTLSDFGVDLGDIYKKNLGDFGKTVKEIIETTELPEDLQNALIGLANYASNNTNSSDGKGSDNSSGNKKFDFKSLTDGFTLSIDEIIAKFMELFVSIENVNAVLNPWDTMFKGLFEILEPITNEVLAPIVGALKLIGQTLGQVLVPLLTSLTPVIKLLSDAFTWLYNYVLLPMGNTLIVLFVIFKNAIINMVNTLISLINLFPWSQMDLIANDSFENYALKEISASDLGAIGSVGATSSGSASSYTAARDIYVNIAFDHSFVNGDAQEIAIMLKDEIARAERLGY